MSDADVKAYLLMNSALFPQICISIKLFHIERSVFNNPEIPSQDKNKLKLFIH